MLDNKRGLSGFSGVHENRILQDQEQQNKLKLLIFKLNQLLLCQKPDT